ncbi:MAG: hypothetical protein EZS28_056159, partial [Streblomastix strix]
MPKQFAGDIYISSIHPLAPDLNKYQVFCGTISEGDLAYTEQKKSNICDDAGRTNDGSNDDITCM